MIEQTARTWKKEKNSKPTVLLLGVTYKPNIDDLRESPALLIAKHLCNNEDMEALVSEPHIKTQKLQDLFGDKQIDTQAGIQRADIIVYLVAHKRFKIIDTKLLRDKIIIDFCGLHHRSASKDREFSIWPANGMLDFFIVNNSKASHRKEGP